jgi:hypothetical protein
MPVCTAQETLFHEWLTAAYRNSIFQCDVPASRPETRLDVGLFQEFREMIEKQA